MAGRLLLLLSFLVLAALPAVAEEDPRQPGLAAHLAGRDGLTGGGSMIDGEIPSPLFGEPGSDTSLSGYSARFVLRYGYDVRRRDASGTSRGRVRTEQHSALALHGITVHGLDFAVGLPYEWHVDRTRVAGRIAPPTSRENGVGSVLVAAKVGLRVPKFILGKWAVAGIGFYGVGRLATGADSVEAPSQFEGGLALIGPFGHSLRYHGNFALLHTSGGHSSFVFRVGGSAIPVAGEDFTFRFYGHLSGADHEGSAGLDLDFEIGGQVLLFGLLTFDVDVSVGLLDGGYIEPDLRRATGDAFTRIDHKGSLTLTFGLGVVL
jgi:hypothetical protein